MLKLLFYFLLFTLFFYQGCFNLQISLLQNTQQHKNAGERVDVQALNSLKVFDLLNKNLLFGQCKILYCDMRPMSLMCFIIFIYFSREE